MQSVLRFFKKLYFSSNSVLNVLSKGLKCLVIRNTVSSFLKKLMLHLISPSGILTNVCLGTYSNITFV